MSKSCRWGLLAALIGLALGCDGPWNRPETYQVTLLGDPGATAYVAVQDGDDVWRRLDLQADGGATFEVSRGYHGVIYTCGPSESGNWLVRSEFDAGPQTVEMCVWLGRLVTVSGAVNPPTASVWIGNSFQSHAPGAYQHTVRPGLIDIAALTATRMVIYRDEQVADDRVIDLDVVADGFDLVPVAPRVSGAGGASVARYARLVTANRTVIVTGSVDAPAIVPAAERVAGDRMLLAAGYQTPGGMVIVQREVVGDAVPPLVFDGTPEFGVVTLAGKSVGGRVGNGWDGTRFALQRPGGGGLALEMNVSGAWGDAAGVAMLPWIQTVALPGIDGRWPHFTTGTTLRWWADVVAGDVLGDSRQGSAQGLLTW